MSEISIVIPVYNVEPYLRECLDSVLAQSFRDLEIICVDDGSTDGSSAILDDYARRDARIRIICQANGGLSAARNTGMDAAAGKYLYFLDSDDMIAQNAMERLHDVAEERDVDQILFGTELVLDSDLISRADLDRMVRYYAVPEELANQPTDGADLFSRLIERDAFFASVPLRFFLRESIPSWLRFPPGLLHEDNYFSPLALLQAHNAIAIPDQFYRRRIRQGSITTSNDKSTRHAEGLRCIYRGLLQAERNRFVPKSAHRAFRLFVRSIYRSFLGYAGANRPAIARPIDFIRGHGLVTPLVRRFKRICFHSNLRCSR